MTHAKSMPFVYPLPFYRQPPVYGLPTLPFSQENLDPPSPLPSMVFQKSQCAFLFFLKHP